MKVSEWKNDLTIIKQFGMFYIAQGSNKVTKGHKDIDSAIREFEGNDTLVKPVKASNKSTERVATLTEGKTPNKSMNLKTARTINKEAKVAENTTVTPDTASSETSVKTKK